MLKATRSRLTCPATALEADEVGAVLGLEAVMAGLETAVVEPEAAVLEPETAVVVFEASVLGPEAAAAALEDTFDPVSPPPKVLELGRTTSTYGTTID